MKIEFTPRFIVTLTLCLSLLGSCLAGTARADELDVWIGTTTPRNGLSKGIYYLKLNTENGKLTPAELAAEINSPGFLALHPNGQVLYATGRVAGEASLVAYRISQTNGRSSLSLMNSQPVGDGGAAHLSTDRGGKVLMSAQYGGGSIAIFPLTEDGSIGPRSKLVKHEGASGVVARRQDKSHAHWVGTSPDNRFAFVPDLGLDKVAIYQLDAEQANLKFHGFGQLPPGSGPRHMTFHTGGRFIYVLNELDLSVTAFAYDVARGRMTPFQTIPTVPVGEKAKEMFVSASEIRVHPNGRFLYAANRGHDTITAFAIDAKNGRLRFVEREPIRGSWPRNFNIDPSGKWLLAAGRDSNTLAVFAINSDTGELTYTRTMVMVPSPICVLFGS